MNTVADRGLLTREDRSFTFDQVELRAEDETTLTFDGVASVVDTPYLVRDSFGEFEETIVAGAFRKTLREKDDVRLLVNHDGIPLARRAGRKGDTLTLTADPHLRAVAPLDAGSPLVQTVRSAMDRGDMDQMSIGFRVTRQEWNGDYTVRAIKEVQLFDVSLVTYPASPTTAASLRSVDELIETLDAYDGDDLRRMAIHLASLIEPPAVEPLSTYRDLAYELLAKRHA